MDDFVKRAFAEATETEMKCEVKAFKEKVLDNIDAILLTIGIGVGVGRMDRLADTVKNGDVKDVFANFLRESLAIAFHIGYKTGREK